MSIKQEPVPMEKVLPSFGEWKRNGESVNLQILVLEIKDKDDLTDDILGVFLLSDASPINIIRAVHLRLMVFVLDSCA